jgi:hypothetical protein
MSDKVKIKKRTLDEFIDGGRRELERDAVGMMHIVQTARTYLDVSGEMEVRAAVRATLQAMFERGARILDGHKMKILNPTPESPFVPAFIALYLSASDLTDWTMTQWPEGTPDPSFDNSYWFALPDQQGRHAT